MKKRMRKIRFSEEKVTLALRQAEGGPVSGAEFRVLPVIDVFTREAFAVEVRESFRGGHVVKESSGEIIGMNISPEDSYYSSTTVYSLRMALFNTPPELQTTITFQTLSG